LLFVIEKLSNCQMSVLTLAPNLRLAGEAAKRALLASPEATVVSGSDQPDPKGTDQPDPKGADQPDPTVTDQPDPTVTDQPDRTDPTETDRSYFAGMDQPVSHPTDLPVRVFYEHATVVDRYRNASVILKSNLVNTDNLVNSDILEVVFM
jgi:hypothetical protein